jgi:membrane protein YdbS with pleckstrin-like domain
VSPATPVLYNPLMSCLRCQTALPDGSAFCHRCGTPVAVPAPAVPPSPVPTAPEQELWKGRYSGKMDAHLWVFWCLWISALLYLWFGVLSPAIRSRAYAPWIFAGATVLPAAGLGWGLLLHKLSVRYRLTTHRLFRERGILVRKYDEIELIRVDDVSVRQNLLQRVFNVGTVVVIASSDATEPHLEMDGIQDPIEVKERIRGEVRKRRERSLFMESL